MAVWASFNDVDCHKCNSQIRQVRGCQSDRAPYVIEGYTLTRCPLTYLSGIEVEYIKAYHHFKNGFLPNQGGWLEQPKKFMDVIMFVERVITEMVEKYDNGRAKS